MPSLIAQMYFISSLFSPSFSYSLSFFPACFQGEIHPCAREPAQHLGNTKISLKLCIENIRGYVYTVSLQCPPALFIARGSVHTKLKVV